MCTRPDIAPCLTFLASYQQSPSEQHYKAAVHALKYLYSTNEYGISFHSNSSSTLQAFNHFPHHHDKEAYTDATPPSPAECHKLTGFSVACWGDQFGNAVPDRTPLKLFKFRSLSGYVVARSGGPISWRSIRQAQCAQSLCEAEVIATNECALEVENILPTTLAVPMRQYQLQSTMTILPALHGHRPSQQRASNTSISTKQKFMNYVPQDLHRSSIFLVRSTRATSLPRKSKMRLTSDVFGIL